MLETVARTVARFRMFQPGQRVAVAVSGGADSVCLLHVLVELAPRWGLRLSVAHFDHRLRGEESRADAEFVAELARGLGLPFHEASADVAALAQQSRDNLEQAARRARRDFFLDLLRRGKADRVALGHTRSDQAETVLFRLLRGTGTAGLAGIWPVTAEGFVRPLIEVSRSDVEAYLRGRGLKWRLDRTNLDPRWARNRIRLELLPKLRQDWNPAIEQLLAQTAMLAREEEEYWAQEIDKLAARVLRADDGAWLAPVAELRQLPPAAARRLIRKAMELVKGGLRGLEFEHVDAVLSLAWSNEGSGQVTAPGVQVCRSLDWLRLAPPGQHSRPESFRILVPGPGSYCTPLGIQIRVSFCQPGQMPGAPDGCAWLDYERLVFPLELRNWMPGDRYQPAGQRTTIRLKELFQRARVPLWERAKWPIMVSGGEVVWAWRFGPSARHLAQPGCQLAVRIEAIKQEAASSEVPPGGSDV